MTDKQRITEILKAYTKRHNISASSVILEEYAEELLANGVIVPPCNVGDKLFVISQMRDKRILPFVNEYEATSIKLGKRKCVVYHEKDGFIKIFKQDDFGKTVFLTKSQAEEALKNEQEKL